MLLSVVNFEVKKPQRRQAVHKMYSKSHPVYLKKSSLCISVKLLVCTFIFTFHFKTTLNCSKLKQLLQGVSCTLVHSLVDWNSRDCLVSCGILRILAQKHLTGLSYSKTIVCHSLNLCILMQLLFYQ